MRRVNTLSSTNPMMKPIQTFLVLSAFPAGTAFVPVKPKSAVVRNIALKYANNHDDRLPSLLCPFDLNGDGRLDMMDMKIFQSSILHTLDLNGDGVLNFTDVFIALQIVALSWVLTVSPAAAKGGGHGGGGHGGGAHSYSSSYSHSSPGIHQYSSSSQPYPSSYVAAPYRRNWFRHNWKYDKPWNPAACYDMPGEGEHIKVLIPNHDRGAKYVPGLVTQASEKDCTFTVQEKQSPNDASTAKKAPTIHSFQTMRNWNDDELLFPLYCITTIGGAGIGINLVSEAMADYSDKRFDEEFLKSKFRFPVQPLPASGKYLGSTQESDGANQNVKVKLQFDAETREITGSGYDSQDGKYHVKGEWAGDKVKWTERYQRESFRVDVRGRLNKDSTKLDCRFVSSREVRGTFQLRKARDSWIPF